MIEQALVARPEEALAERVHREKARRHLVDFCEYVTPWYRAARHHRLIAEYLELVETYIRTGGKTGIGRLMVLMPPRHGKTELVSRRFPAWVMGKNPDKRVAMTSYGADLAEENSRAVRELVKGTGFAAAFGALAITPSPQPSLVPRDRPPQGGEGERGGRGGPVEISSDSRAVKGWDLAAPHRGGLAAAGVGGPLTGKGAHLLVVDDPMKNREEAESERARQRVWEWYTSTAYTRLEEGGAIVVIQTRWHGDDLAGRLLAAMAEEAGSTIPATTEGAGSTIPATTQATGGMADRWVVVSLMDRWEETTLAEGKEWEEFYRESLREGIFEQREDPLCRQAGEAIWPQKYNEDDLARIEANIGPYDYQALYKQRPFAKQGRKFQREWFTVVDEPPKAEEMVARVRFWDKAGTKGGGAYSCGVLMCRTSTGLIYVEHVERGQWEAASREERIVETGRSDRQRPGPGIRIKHEREPGSSGMDSAQMTNARLAREGFEAEFELPTGDKEVRAGPWASAGMAGIVRLVKGGWNEAYIQEHMSFPKGKYKDQVDASSGAYKEVGVIGYSDSGGIFA